MSWLPHLHTEHKYLHNGLGSSKNRPGEKGSETECKGVIHNDDWVPVDRVRGSWVVWVCSLPSHDQQGTVAGQTARLSEAIVGHSALVSSSSQQRHEHDRPCVYL
jgi:hypothetical protein